MSPRLTIRPRNSSTSTIEGGASRHPLLDLSARFVLVWLIAAGIAVAAQACARIPVPKQAGAAGHPRLSVNYGTLPLSFEANQGQSDEQVKFLARGQGYSLFLTPSEAVLRLRAPAQQKPSARAAEQVAANQRSERDDPAQPAAVVRMRFVGANTGPQLTGLDPLPGTSNYFIGGDPARWRHDVPNFARVKYASVYPGIDVIYRGNQRQLEYDLVVAPGADPGRIALAFEGVHTLSLDTEGNLVLQTGQGVVAQHKPVIYQDIGVTRQRVDGRYVLRANDRVGFQIASYDTTRPLVIDPVLSYSTYLGGGGNDIGRAIAVDAFGNAYVTGETNSVSFPGAGASPIQAGWAGSYDVFVTKINAAGNALLYSTYLGGSGGDFGYAIAVDSTGCAYVTGETDSPTAGFPNTSPFPRVGAFQALYHGGGDAFVTKLSSSGSALVYSTYLGGSGTERGYGIAIDSSFNAYVTGHTSSSQGNVPGPTDFPTVAPFQAQNSSLGSFDAFVTKFNPSGSALVYSTYLGGNGSEYSTYGGAIAVDGDGNAYVGGTTASANFPGASSSTIQPTYGGGTKDGFVVKFNTAGSALVYSTYLGGNGFYDEVNGIAIDSARNAYVVGYTDALDFPTALPLQASRSGFGNDAFVSKINAAGTSLVYSTYLGGSNGDIAYGVAVDSGGNAHVSGWTASSNFPTMAPFQATNGGGGDAFITELNATGSALVFSTFLGGSTGSESGYGIALDSAANTYVTGETNSTNFPTVGPYQATLGGGGTDVFVAKVTSSLHRRYFAEGAATAFFDCYFALANPSPTTVANVTLRFLRDDSQTVTYAVQVPAMSRRTVNAKDVPGLTPSFGFSTILESDIEVVADRTMTWDSSGYGSHAETSIAAPAQIWYLAEGATQNGFQLDHLIENPNAGPVDVQVSYLRLAPNAPIDIVHHNILGNSRTTILVNSEDPRLASGDVSAVITSLTPNRPIIVERAMYLNNGGVTFNAGHVSAGVTTPATDWFLAEGATVGTFDMYILLANPGDTAGTATVTYMLEDGRTLVKSYAVAARSRQTVWVNGERDDANPAFTLRDVSLSAMVHGSVPIIVERSMWWSATPGGPWHEAHNAVGTTETGTAWAVADGEQGGARGTDTYVLVANTSAFPGWVHVTLLCEDGTNPSTAIYMYPNSRTTVWTGGTAVGPNSRFGGLVAGKRFGAVVESQLGAFGTPRIVVERAMYSNASGVIWAAGTDVVATRLR